MTRDEILNIPSGRELDVLVAKQIFGFGVMVWINHPDIDPKVVTPDEIDLLHYSTDIAAAWEVVNHFVSRRKRPKIDRVAENEWRVQLDDFDENAVAYSSSAPLAICRAALLAVMENE